MIQYPIHPVVGIWGVSDVPHARNRNRGLSRDAQPNLACFSFEALIARTNEAGQLLCASIFGNALFFPVSFRQGVHENDEMVLASSVSRQIGFSYEA